MTISDPVVVTLWTGFIGTLSAVAVKLITARSYVPKSELTERCAKCSEDAVRDRTALEDRVVRVLTDRIDRCEQRLLDKYSKAIKAIVLRGEFPDEVRQKIIEDL